MACQRVDPRAWDPSSRLRGRDSKASVDRLTMVGTIITARMAADTANPAAGESESHFPLTQGSTTMRPKMP